jgi:hypothetical protein
MAYLHRVSAVDLGVQMPLAPIRVEKTEPAAGVHASLLQVGSGEPVSAAEPHEVDLGEGRRAPFQITYRLQDDSSAAQAREHGDDLSQLPWQDSALLAARS